MYKIAIIDDEKTVIEQAKGLLESYSAEKNVEFEIKGFVGDSPIDVDRISEFDIVILDINMPVTNGLQIAKMIRDVNSETIIIFCTNYAQYALNGYEVGALGYIIKPITEYSIFKNIDRAIAALKKRESESSEKERFVITNAEGRHIISIEDLMFVEVIKHDLYFNVLKEGKVVTYQTRGTMYEMCEKLEKNGFARCYVSYLINLDHVVSVNKQKCEIKLTDGRTMPLSRNFQKSFFAAFVANYKD